MKASHERWMLVVTPFAAMTAVGVGLRLGAPDVVLAAVVHSAPSSEAGGLAWQVVAFRAVGGVREPLAGRPIEVRSRAGQASARWSGTTDEDGVAEMHLPFSGVEIVSLDIESGREVLAQGDARVPPPLDRGPRIPPWMPFTLRQGPVDLDVAVLGQSLAPSFPAAVWVRATDAATHDLLSRVALDAESEGSLAFATVGVTGPDGWAEIRATALGFALTLSLQARSHDGRTGRWQGGLFASPGAASIETRKRWAPLESIEISVVAPTSRRTEYLEIDDARGRAWATSVELSPRSDGSSSAAVVAPGLPAGLYWAVASSDAAGASTLGPGTSAMPFFVAASDRDALELAPDPSGCSAGESRKAAGANLTPCLALAAAVPVARWTALDGYAKKEAPLRKNRSRGVTVAVGSVLVAMTLEAILVVRAAARGRRRMLEGSAKELPMGPRVLAVVALLVGLLGFALIAAFVLRWA